MELKDTDYQSLMELQNSHGWKLICNALDEKIKSIESILLDPTLDEIKGLEDDKVQQSVMKYKKMERIHLINLKNLPQTLLDTKIRLT